MARPRFRYRKYHNQPVIRDGFWFASKKEANRYRDLKLLEAAGEISDLQRQVKFTLEVNGIRITTYRVDFTYKENGQVVIEDVKGPILEPYEIKKNLMKACLGIEVREI